MTNQQLWLVIGCMVLATFPFRLASFVLYRKLKNNELLTVLGKKLPPIMMLLLVLYSVKDAVLVFNRDILYQLLSIAVVAAVHWRWHHVLLSIGTGLGLYLALINY